MLGWCCAQEGSGVVGIVLVLLIYVVLFIISAVLLYTYLLRLHAGGRLLDLYARLSTSVDSSTVPLDTEVRAACSSHVLVS